MDEALITRKIEIDMGHRVPNHKSKCRNLHGHRYVIEITVHGPLIDVRGSSDEGMVADFGDLKELLMSEVDARFDHGFMMYEHDPLAESFRTFEGQKIIFVPFIPTAENFAKHIQELLSDKLRSRGLRLASVTVRETPNSSATIS